MLSSLLLAAALSFSGNPTAPAHLSTPADAGIEFSHASVQSVSITSNHSDVTITVLVRIQDSLLTLTSESYSYVEASDQLRTVLNELIAK